MKTTITIKSEDYINGILISSSIESKEDELVWKDMNDIKIKKSAGIGFMDLAYIEINDIQDKADELKKISKFLNKYMNQYAEKMNINSKDLNLDFINYGKTELVYLLTDNLGNKITLLVKQPAVEFGKVKQEAENLIELGISHDNIVIPIDYYKYGDYELYVTPYINQARCVASYNDWGMYIPEPYYRFEAFSSEQEKIVNTCMIAKLVSLYNFEKNEGICSCKLGGGDFMLPKGWELEEPTIENTLDNLSLIAAREKINCNFDDYLNIIRNEFSRSTINEEEKNLIINLRGRVPMKIEDIESGIQLGKQIIANSCDKQLVKKRKFDS